MGYLILGDTATVIGLSGCTVPAERCMESSCCHVMTPVNGLLWRIETFKSHLEALLMARLHNRGQELKIWSLENNI